MKIYEGIICNRIVRFLQKNGILSPYQAAYRKKKSTADQILIIHELFLEYRFNKVGPRGGKIRKVLYLCFLDFRKAFDTVPRHILFYKLHKLGITRKLLRVIQNLFSSNPANVLIDGFLSPDFVINRGVLQGSKLGPILFNIFINDLLNELQNTGIGAFIGPIHIPALGFADDIVLISDDPEKLQKLIDKCQSWASKNGMSFNTSKCKVMVFNGSSTDMIFTLNDEQLQIVETYKYLGVILSSKYITNLFRQHYAKITQKARIRSNILKRHGFHEDGLRLKTAIRLYKIVIRPILEYCGQTLSYSRYRQQSRGAEPNGFARELEHLQTQILKNIINCPRSTSPSIVRLFCCVEPLMCRFEMLKLRYFWKTLKCSTDSITHKVLKYRKENLLAIDKGFAHEVFNICCKYKLLHLWHGSAANHKNPPQAIKKIIISHNLQKDLDIGRKKKCSFVSIFLIDPKGYEKNYRLAETCPSIDS